MRSPTQAPRPSRPAPAYGPRAVLTVTAVALAALLALLVAASHPTVVAGAAMLALAARHVARPSSGARSTSLTRRRTARRLCVPGTDVCLEA